MSDRFKHVTASLGPLFADLERRVQATVDLATQVRAALPAPEKDHVVSVTCRDDTLVVLADSAAWCPRIRYGQQALLATLRKAGETRFTKLKVRVTRRGA